MPGAKRIVRRLRRHLRDARDRVTGKRNPLVPPPHRRGFWGAGDFLAIGEEFFGYLKTIGRLEPNDRVLDIGCGIGRIAIPLTGYLNSEGCYEGFDIVPRGIEWCSSRITPRHPNFKFQLADIFNKHYNPAGRYAGEEYRFPYEDNSFDFVFLTSVFTHMLPGEVKNYLREIARVLDHGGRALMTWFLMNDESRSLVSQGRTSLDFSFNAGGYFLVKPDVPEFAVAFPEEDIRDLIAKSGLIIEEPIHYGSWCDRPNSLSYQDIIVVHTP